MTDCIPALVGPAFRRARERSGLSLRAAAELVGVSHVALGNVERQARLPSLSTVYAAAAAYGVKPAKLVPAK